MQRSRYGGAFENRLSGFDGYKLTELSEELQIRHETRTGLTAMRK
ncbi:hypothetical protein PO124_15835 [Bacillus licheniformis]|nr:hypothetical protein [Bacillus licheniformis]